MTYTKAINVNGVNLGIVTYTYNATEIQNLPAVPEKIGYTGQWDYTVNGSELTILPVYEPITYYATFMADGEQVGERIPFTVESSSIAESQVPTKLGYSGRWRPYTLQASDITIIAEYDLSSLANGERKLLLLIIRRMIEAACEEYISETVSYTFSCGDYLFTAKETTVKQIGWKVFSKQDKEENKGSLSGMKPGDTFSVAEGFVKEGKVSNETRAQNMFIMKQI